MGAIAAIRNRRRRQETPKDSCAKAHRQITLWTEAAPKRITQLAQPSTVAAHVLAAAGCCGNATHLKLTLCVCSICSTLSAACCCELKELQIIYLCKQVALDLLIFANIERVPCSQTC
jgi:hypothetical protein